MTFLIKFNFFNLLIDSKVIFSDLLIKKWLNLIKKRSEVVDFNQKEIENRSN